MPRIKRTLPLNIYKKSQTKNRHKIENVDKITRDVGLEEGLAGGKCHSSFVLSLSTTPNTAKLKRELLLAYIILQNFKVISLSLKSITTLCFHCTKWAVGKKFTPPFVQRKHDVVILFRRENIHNKIMILLCKGVKT